MCNNIVKLRKKLGMTQKILAERLDVSQQFISEIENGKTIPSLMFAYSLKKVLGCESVEDIFFIC